MPVNFEFDEGIIALRMTDFYVPEDIRNALLQGLADPGTLRPIGLLFDVSRSQSLGKRSAADVVAMGYFLARHADSFSRRVALVGFDDFPFAMMRMGHITLESEGIRSEVFREEANAREWLLHGPA